eukprot:COSAG06_NODE_413_length_16040_cov_8.901386_25_plen_64_part_00
MSAASVRSLHVAVVDDGLPRLCARSRDPVPCCPLRLNPRPAALLRVAARRESDGPSSRRIYTL